MSSVVVTFKTDGDAFRQPSGDLSISEVDSVLKQACTKIYMMANGGTVNLRDSNGNTVGMIQIEEDA